MFLLDVDRLIELGRELPLVGVNSPGLYSFHDDDHFQMVPGGPRANIEAFLKSEGINERPDRILLLTNLRFLGYTFNPISVWFCLRHDSSPVAAVAEVGNTFGELKPFLVPWTGKQFHLRAPKHFYVSPFSPLDLEFDFHFELPGEFLRLWIDDYCGSERILISTLAGRSVPLDAATLLTVTAKYPLITLKVIALIHWQAFRLWLKKIPFFYKEDNPARQTGIYRPHKADR
ncbi:MAG: DUF1365 domain-containing protein [Terrimicrobiaceae bacterium]